MSERVLTDVEIYYAFSRMVAKQDHWRGYLGDEVTDDEVIDWLDRAYAALLREAVSPHSETAA